MLPTKHELSTLLAALYEAAGDSSLWPAFLRELGRMTQSSQSAILMHDLRHGEHGISLQWGTDASAARLYEEYFGARDLWLQKAAPFSHEGWLGTSEEVCSIEELRRSEFYNDYLRPNRIGTRALWGVLENSDSRIINVGLYRDVRRPFGRADLELLRFLSPHIIRAFRLHLQLSELKARAQNLQHAIDKVTTGIILLGKDARIIHINQTAAKLLAQNDGLRALHGYLQAEHNGEAEKLKHLISAAQATSMGLGFAAGGAVAISRRSGPALNVLITSVRNMTFASAIPVYAIAFVTDPSEKVRPVAEILPALFGLTPAETRVALLLCDGYTLPAISDLVGVSANTLKTQLASIYRKTGTSRQTQLVRLQLASTTPALGGM